MLKFHYTLIAGSLPFLLIMNLHKLILKRLKDTSEIKIRHYNKTLALKRIAMSNSYNKGVDMSYIIDDYQQYNGDLLLLKHIVFIIDSLKFYRDKFVSVILCISYINNANS